jgi:UDP-GlcNAc:undecaprenyl-phosphate/decaprenyl-phosphate GlcNAc-1-phosphate transferase
MGLVVAFVAALLIAVAATPLARRTSFALGIVDRPGPLKVQHKPVAYLGGVAVFVALAATLAPTHPGWILPLGLAAALGLADDVRSISPRLRLVMQVSIGCVAGVIEPAPGRFGWIATAGFVVVLVNAVNLLDGMDGLAASVVTVSALGFALVGGDVALPALAVCGALVGFLVYNRPAASIYLGDSGSYLLGTALALLAAFALDGQGSAAWIALPLFVGLPVADTAIAIIRRYRAGKPLLAGDRSHVYDQFADRGWPIVRVLFVCVGLQVASSAAGLVAWHLDAAGAAGVVVACTAVVALAVWKIGFVSERAVV